MKKQLRYSIVLMLLFIGTVQAFAQSAMPDTVCVGATKKYTVNNPTVPSTYTWKVNGVSQASTQNEISITWNTLGVFQLTVQERGATGCDGDIRSAMVYVNDGNRRDTLVTACNSFTWNRNNVTYTTGGNYNYITVNANGCNDTITLKLTITLPVTPTFVQIGPLCKNAPAPALPFTSTNGITGAWNPATINTSATGTTVYTFTPNAGQCANSTTMSVDITPSISSIRYNTVNAVYNVPKQLQARSLSPTDQYLWSPFAGLSSASIYNPVFKYVITTEYFIAITTGTGCSVTDTLLVKILPPSPAPLIQFSDVFIPDAFSPNGDGYNDKFTPMLFKISDLKYFRVFNRWGSLVFETKIPGEGWDGYFKGVKAAADVYTWTIEAIGTDKRMHSKRGTTILLK